MNKRIQWGVVAVTLAILLVLTFDTLKQVGTSLGGNINWIPLTSEFFGTPEELENAGYTSPYARGGNMGWDGQFYYFISNDLLATKGYDIHVDAPGYRWQRIGLPMLASLLSHITLQKYVSPVCYVGTNLLLIAIMIYMAGVFFREKKRSALNVLPWALSIGTLITVHSLLPDAAADALAIIAFILLLKKRYTPYAIIMTMTVLTREGYLVFAFVIFVFAFLGIINKEKRYNIPFALLIGLPGIVFITWYIFLRFRFGHWPFEAAIGIQQFFMTGWYDQVVMLNGTINTHFMGLLLYLIAVICAFIFVFMAGKKRREYYAWLPYIFLCSSFGKTVMAEYSGYLKGISIFFILVPMAFAEIMNGDKLTLKSTKGKLKSILCGLIILLGCTNVVFSITTEYRSFDGATIRYMTPYPCNVKPQEAQEIKDFSGTIQIEDMQDNKYVSNGFINHFTDPYTVIRIKLTNQSSETWYPYSEEDGKFSVGVIYHWAYNQEGVSLPDGPGIHGTARTYLKEPLYPGDSVELEMNVRYPSIQGSYKLLITAIQEGVAESINYGQCYNDTLLIEVK